MWNSRPARSPLTARCTWWSTPPGRGSVVADTHAQRVSFSGSVKKPKIVSGLAAMRTSRTIGSVVTASGMALAPLVFLRLATQRLEPLVPELLQERADVPQTPGPRAVQAARPLAPLVEQPRLAQHAQVLRDRRARHVAELGGDGARGELVGPHQAQDVAAARVGDGLDDVLHRQARRLASTNVSVNLHLDMRAHDHGALARQPEVLDGVGRVARHRDEELLAPRRHARRVGGHDGDPRQEV